MNDIALGVGNDLCVNDPEGFLDFGRPVAHSFVLKACIVLVPFPKSERIWNKIGYITIKEGIRSNVREGVVQRASRTIVFDIKDKRPVPLFPRGVYI